MVRNEQVPDRNIAMELVRTTEAAALAAARWQGRGDNHAADQAAVDAMRKEFAKLPISGRVVIGEGEKDKAPQLYNGEEVGAGGMQVDIGVDPLEGTDLVSRGDEGAIAICVIAERGGDAVGSLLVTTEWSDWRNGVFRRVQSVYVLPAARRPVISANGTATPGSRRWTPTCSPPSS